MKKYFLFIFLFFTSFSFSQEIIGEWNFDYILPDSVESGKNLKIISDGDAMQINEDGTFSYKLQEIKLSEKGRWSLDTVNSLLTYHYTNKEIRLLPNSPNHQEILNFNKTRTYKITLKDNRLVLNEDGINYAFTKPEIEEIVTSGITINSISRGILGIFSLLLIAFLFSRNRKGIDWMLVAKGLGIQIIFAIFTYKSLVIRIHVVILYI